MTSMGEGHQVSSLPLPPMQYVNLYTPNNISRGRAPQPPAPIQDMYSMFSVTFHVDDQIIRPLETQGIKRLYPQNVDHKRELRKLNHSILVNFLYLLDILVKSPCTNKRKEKIDDINLLFIHMHHLINEFRPHQARETLRVMLEVQKKQRLEVAERFQKHLDGVAEKVHNCLSSLPDPFSTDSCTMVNSEINEMDVDSDNKSTDKCDSLDKLMCDIVDVM